jgi:glutamate--cysteine ligase
MVPHLITALTGPINELEQRILDSMPAIERWFRLEWMEHTPPFYSSVDLRNAGFKLAPVDTNLFPGGFNNLTPEMLPLAVQAAMAAIEKICPEAKNLLLIPENHTRNTFYLSNVQRLMQIFTHGRAERAPGLAHPGRQGTHRAGPARRQRDHAGAAAAHARPPGPEGLRPLHHPAQQRPLGRRAPGILEDLHEQYLLPPLHAGWTRAPQEPAFPELRGGGQEVRQAAGHGPLADQPDVRAVRARSTSPSRGPGVPAGNVDALLTKIRRKYKEYGINEKPFVVVKADNGTYGMGIMTVRDAKELDRPEPPHRNKMSVVKDGQEVTEVIIQEGVLTTSGQRRGGRAGGLHDGPLRGGRLLPRARRARRRREPQRPAPASCRWPSSSRPTCRARARSQGPVPPTASTCTA